MGSRQDKWKMVGYAIALIYTGILAILFRNNAVYAIVPFAIFYILVSQKQRLYIAILCIAIIAGGLGCKEAIHTAMECGTGSKIEMYSVFMQQFARTGLRQNERLSDEERKIIDYYIPEESWDVYNATIADGVKAHSGTRFEQEWQYHVTSMLSDWIKIGIRYPNEYIDAFLALTSGYWFLDDVSHAEVLTYGEDTNFGLLYTFNASFSDAFHGIESKSILPGLLSTYQKIVNGNSYYSWPILSLLFKPAFYCWLLLLVMFSHWYMKQHQKLFMSIFATLYLFTLLLGPVAIVRYAYPIIITVPVLIAHAFYTER